jgi:hypothetical protein
VPDRVAETTDTAPLAPRFDWPEVERVYRDLSLLEPIDGDPESVGDVEEIPF